MLRNTKKYAAGGFTLVEAIVVVAVMVMLTAILLGYSRNSEKQIVFFKEESLLIGSILRAKGFAIETFQPEIQPGVVSAPSRIVCGWGIHFEEVQLGGQGGGPNRNSYTIFQDLAEAGGNCNQNPEYNQDEDFEVFDLDEKVIQIDCVDLIQGPVIPPGTPCGGGSPMIDVIFIPPDPKVDFHPGGPNIQEAVIVLKLADGSRESLIRVNRAGQISID